MSPQRDPYTAMVVSFIKSKIDDQNVNYQACNLGEFQKYDTSLKMSDTKEYAQQLDSYQILK